MIEFDAAEGPGRYPDSDPHPRRDGRRVTDLQAIGGGLIWVVFVAAAWVGFADLDAVELFVALALLVLVPLGFGLAATPRRSGGRSLPYSLAVTWQLPAAALAAASLAVPPGSLVPVLAVLPWLGVTGAVALFGLWRLLSRGVGPLPELAVDAAMLYLPVGAVALLLHQAGVSLGFRPMIVLLTAVHYHYAGFVLPLVAGLAGRVVAGQRGGFGGALAGRVASAATVVIVVNLALIAVGITFSPLVEVVAVGLFTAAVAAFAVFVLLPVVPDLPRRSGALLGVGALVVVATMALALAYGYSAFSATGELITIGEMVRYHGTLNAFGFALPALLAFRLADA